MHMRCSTQHSSHVQPQTRLEDVLVFTLPSKSRARSNDRHRNTDLLIKGIVEVQEGFGAVFVVLVSRNGGVERAVKLQQLRTAHVKQWAKWSHMLAYTMHIV